MNSNVFQKIRIFINNLDDALVKDRCSLKENFHLLCFVLLLFAFQQMFEALILSDLNKDYVALCRWDCAWYGSIVHRGYDVFPEQGLEQKNFAFFPLFPIFVAGLQYALQISLKAALIMSSKVFFLLSIFAFIKLSKQYFSEVSFLVSGMVVAFNPYVIYANVGYTETLFLLLTCSCLYFMKQKKVISCGIVGGLLGATRLVGICITVSYAIFLIKDFFKMTNAIRFRILLGGCALLSGLISFMIFLHFHTGDAFAFLHISQAWGRHIGNPILHLISGFRDGSFSVLLSLNAIMALCCCVYLFIKKYYHLAIFSFLCTIIPLLTGLVSMPRYVWFQAPVLLVLAKLSSKAPFSVLCLSTLWIYFIYSVWFSGFWFVI